MAANEQKDFSFLKNFKKEVAKMDGIVTTSEPPRYWYSSGNRVLDYTISGAYNRGIPQGRITNIAGPSGAGKSYLATNFLVEAQRNNAFTLVIDSENALDNGFVSKIGFDPTDEKYSYCSVMTIPHVVDVVSTYLKGYREEFGEALDAPHVFILIDSLDMLMTETEYENFGKGITKGDQGQKNKQLKSMLRSFVQAIKSLNITMVCTSQVYANQNVLNGEGVWIVADAVKYACSQIILVQKRKLKDESTGAKAGAVSGVRIVAEGYKTRFAKPFQRVEIEVPYETGMDPYSGLVEAALNAGVIIKKGSYYRLADSDELWYAKNIATVADEIFTKLQAMQVVLDISEDTIIDTSDNETPEERRARKQAKVVINGESPTE